MLTHSNFTEKVALLKMITSWEKWFFNFKKANLETGPKRGSVDMLQQKIGPKVAGPVHFEVQ